MKPVPIPEKYANDIWDILMQYAGATEYWRSNFLACRNEITEYRFQGKLGFGGKFWNQMHVIPSSMTFSQGWDVTCYSEDETPERKEMVRKTNERLAELFAQYQLEEKQ
jgi:hypothetical protein